MNDPAPRPLRGPLRDQGLMKWLSVIAMALLTGYAVHPVLSVLLQVAEESGLSLGKAFMPLMLGGQVLAFAVAALVLARRASVALRIEAGCLWSGILLLLTLPVLGLIVWLEASGHSGGGQDGATAAFFMLLIFGGYYAIFGGVLLLIAAIMRRRRIDGLAARPL